VRFAQTELHTSIQGSGNTPAFPAQWLYGLLRALPGERLFCLRRPREVLLPENLTPAPRRPNHTTSPYAQAAHVSRSSRVHRISPRVVTMANAPQSGETGRVMGLIWVRTKAEYFRFPGLTRFRKIRSDLLVGLICRCCAPRLRLRAKQITPQPVVGKAQRAHHFDPRSVLDGGHGANAPLPSLRTTDCQWN
jgi:hypothetical protein